MNKKTIIISLLLVLIFIITLVLILLPKEKENKIANISINGIKINDKATKKMKNLVMDASFQYEYNNVGFSVDKEDKITEIIFHRTQSGDEIYSIKEADVLYKKEKLTTKDDFDKYLGRGETTKDDYFTYITYKEDNLKLRLSIKDGELYNIEITQDK